MKAQLTDSHAALYTAGRIFRPQKVKYNQYVCRKQETRPIVSVRDTADSAPSSGPTKLLVILP